MRIAAHIVVMLFAMSFGRACLAAEYAYTFTGAVTSISGVDTPFGISVPGPPTPAAVSGHFAYDTASPLVSPFTNTYLQHRTNGFYVKFGSLLEVSADDYWVIVSNNVLSGTRDRIDIRFNGSDLAASSLVANGVQQPDGVGLLVARMQFNSNEFASTSLPLGVNPANLNPGSGSLLGDTGGGIDVFFIVNSIAATTLPLASVPEPGSGAMAVLALAGLAAWLRISRYRGRAG